MRVAGQWLFLPISAFDATQTPCLRALAQDTCLTARAISRDLGGNGGKIHRFTSARGRLTVDDDRAIWPKLSDPLAMIRITWAAAGFPLANASSLTAPAPAADLAEASLPATASIAAALPATCEITATA